MARLTEKKKEQIKALLAEGISQRNVAKKLKVSVSTVNKLANSSRDEVEHLRTHKKEEYIEKAWATIYKYMNHVNDPNVIEKTSARDSAILIGTLHDKMIKSQELELKRDEIDIKRKELEQKNKPPEMPNVNVYIEALKGEIKEVFDDE